MFSGLIGAQGTVHASEAASCGGLTLHVAVEPALAADVQPKDSVAVNGACLTATTVSGNLITFDVVPETLERTTLGALHAGDRVNVELSLKLGDRMGGHFVYGHVDARARVLSRNREGQGERVTVECPAGLERMICEKAFVSVDGVSLTVAATRPGCFELALIPETLQRTTLGERPVGALVNLEADPLARYAVAAVDGQPDEHTKAELEWAYEI